MRKICIEVMAWGDRLEFQGVRDDTLPPKVLRALDAYLAESGSKLLVILPIKREELDTEKQRERERSGKKEEESKSALVMECFDPPLEPQQILARLDVIAKHSSGAIINSLEYDRVATSCAF